MATPTDRTEPISNDFTASSGPSTLPNKDINWFESGVVHLKHQLTLLNADMTTAKKCIEDLETLLDKRFLNAAPGHKYCDPVRDKCHRDQERRDLVEKEYMSLSKGFAEMIEKLSSMKQTCQTVMEMETEANESAGE